VTVAIPTINSAQYLDIVLEFYREHGVPITVFVDDRSVDDTLAIARRLASRVIVVRNPAGFIVEGLVEQISRQCQTSWVLRVDDDELPTATMLEFVKRAIAGQAIKTYAFLRHQCIVSLRGKLLASRAISPTDHQQWRLYRPGEMRFIGGLHTPGLVWDGDHQATTAPEEAAMIHLDWILHSYDERRQKVERYDAHTPNEGTRWRSFYLYEENPSSLETLTELDLPEFGRVCREISRRFDKRCVNV
jgi:glycosyltransferase involved in cell wall biosynthesis